MYQPSNKNALRNDFNFKNEGYKDSHIIAAVVKRAKEYNAKEHSDQANLSSIETSVTIATIPELKALNLEGYELDASPRQANANTAVPPIEALAFLNIGQQKYLVGLQSRGGEMEQAYIHPVNLNQRHTRNGPQDTTSLPLDDLNTYGDSWMLIANAIYTEAKLQENLSATNALMSAPKIDCTR